MQYKQVHLGYKEGTMIMLRYFLILIITLLSISIAPAWANWDTSGWSLSAYGGVQQLNLDPSSFTLAGNQVEALEPTHHRINNFTGGLGLAYRFVPITPSSIFRFAHDISIGMDVFYFEAIQHGDTLDYRIFNNFNYRLNVQSVRFMANGEWTFPGIGGLLFPFLEGGIGIASNTASYKDTPNANASTTVGINIAKGSSTQFAYDVGGGIKVPLGKNIQASFRYLYSYLGSATTSKNANLPVSSGVSVSLAPQMWLLGISYLV
jgi:opacity protein-like surface antigen